MKTHNIIITAAIFISFLQINVESKKEKEPKSSAGTEGNEKRPYYYYNRGQGYYTPAVVVASPNRPGGGGHGSKTQKRPVAKQTRPAIYYNVQPYYAPSPVQNRPGGGGQGSKTQKRPAVKQTRPAIYYNVQPYYPPSPAQNRPGDGGQGSKTKNRPVANKKPTKQTRPVVYYNNGPQAYYTPSVASPNGSKMPKSPANFVSPNGSKMPKSPSNKHRPAKRPQPKGFTKNSPTWSPTPSPIFSNGSGNGFISLPARPSVGSSQNFGSCRLCTRSWRVPDPQLELLEETCAHWNMKDKGNVYCPDVQATYGSACGCPDAPAPKCNVCPDGDYVWKQVPRYNTFTDDFCVRMIYKMSKHTEYCMGNRRSVAKMCCSSNRSNVGAKMPEAPAKTGKLERKPKSKSPKTDSRKERKDKHNRRYESSSYKYKSPKRRYSRDSRDYRYESSSHKSPKRTYPSDKYTKSRYFRTKRTYDSRDFRSPSAPRPPYRTSEDTGYSGGGGGRVDYPTGGQGGGGGQRQPYYYYYDDDNADDYYP